MIIVYLVIYICLLLNPNISKKGVLDSLSIFAHNLLPILFPSLILTELIQNNNITASICNYLFPIIKKIYRINYPKSVIIILFSYIVGSPASTKMIHDAVENQEINQSEAAKLIYSFSFLSLPYIFFVLNSYKLAIIFLLVELLYSIIISRIIKSNYEKNEIKKNKSCKFSKLLFSSINKTTSAMISILAIVICFKIICLMFKVNAYVAPFIEPLGGQQALIGIEIKKILNQLIIISSTSFLGLSIHLQILYFYDDFSYIKFILIKLLFALVSMVIIFT